MPVFDKQKSHLLGKRANCFLIFTLLEKQYSHRYTFMEHVDFLNVCVILGKLGFPVLVAIDQAVMCDGVL